MFHAVLLAVVALVAPAYGGSCAWTTGCVIGGSSSCCAHSDCLANQYCFDTGYFLTREWNNVGSCSSIPTDCCANADADPIDRNTANCPAASGCAIGRRLQRLQDPDKALLEKSMLEVSGGAMLSALAKRASNVSRAVSEDEISKHLITLPGRMLQPNNQACALENINTGACGGLSQEVDGCWSTYTYSVVFTTYTEKVCCAESADDCCEINPGALTGVIIGGLVLLFLSVFACVACCCLQCCSCCPCNKHNPANKPRVAPVQGVAVTSATP
jgi:hypothetical protein